MRFLFPILLLLTFPVAAGAVEAPSGQTRLDAGAILRGRFVEEHQANAAQNPFQSSGRFIVAPARGLIWSIEKPFPTSTVVTPNAMVQDIGGMAVKLPARNLRHVYAMVGGALAGDWSGLEQDFMITRGGSARRWQMLLTPRPGKKATLPYATITISGGRFVENIVMAKADGSSDSFSFTDETLSSAALTTAESKLFKEVSR
ncbi:MAG: hypothetical protein P4M13_06865 [Alphaproteobacteria bacterium]|nr:hypothetical protein [Alphaproteobacteria bacterium]